LERCSFRKEAFKLLNQGVAAYKRGEYELAVERLTRSASMALNSFRAHFYLGLALIGDRRYDEALEILSVALDLDPSHLQSHVATGDAHLKLGDLEEARAGYYRALKLRPEYPAALDGLARVYEAQADDQEAITYFQRAIASDRGFAPAYTHLGDLYLRKDQFKEAVELLEEAISVRPDFAGGLNRLAVAYGRLGLTTLAVATIQKAMELEPNQASHPSTLGWLQLGQSSPETAEEWFVKALRLDPDLVEAHMGLAEVARRGGDYQLALGQVDTALADAKLDVAMTKRLEEFREKIEQERRDLMELELTLAFGEASAEDQAALATIYAGRGLWHQAAELQLNAEPSPENQERLAYMLFQAGRFREAHEIYAALAREVRALELDDEEHRLLAAKHELNDGVSVAMLGDDQEASEAYRRALEVLPSSRLARLYLGNALLRLGEVGSAVAEYKTFLGMSDRGEAAERVRRILVQIAPETLPQPGPEIIGPPPEVAEAEAEEGSR
jgi:tetratricopeptide (TPR) repeat protein